MGEKRWGLGTKKELLGWLAKIFLDVVMVTNTRVLDLDYFTKTYICFMWFLVFMLYLTIKILKNRNHSPGGILFSSVQFSRSVVSESVRPHESQHTRPPCPSPTPEFTQIHVHQVGDAIQPSHSLSSTSPPAPNPSQHQSLFQWVISLLNCCVLQSPKPVWQGYACTADI